MMDHEQAEAVLPRLYERDIDVLLQEEVLFNDALRGLLCTAAGLPKLLPKRCALSVSHETGETDILAVFASSSGDVALLIEDKIDAEFQERQPERYRERVLALVGDRKFASAHALLVAPERYLQAAKAQCSFFDGFLSYEALAETICAEATPRAIHRSALLLRAVEQARQAYTLEPVAEVSALWDRIYQIANTEYPELAMRPPGAKGAYSSWLIFKADLPPNVTIDWKITSGVVDLSFWKAARRRPKPDIDLSAIAPASLQQAGEMTVIRLPVPRGSDKWISLSPSDIRTALDAALQLLRFYRSKSQAFV